MTTKTSPPTRWLAAVAAVAALLAIPAAAPAKVLHFKGKATGSKPDKNMRITFDIRASKGKPRTISNVHVTKLDYNCDINGAQPDRGLRIFGKDHFSKSMRFEIAEQDPPPGFKNNISGRFLYPKKGKRKKPTVKGYLSSESGFGLERDSYNCLASEFFTATKR